MREIKKGWNELVYLQFSEEVEDTVRGNVHDKDGEDTVRGNVHGKEVEDTVRGNVHDKEVEDTVHGNVHGKSSRYDQPTIVLSAYLEI